MKRSMTLVTALVLAVGCSDAPAPTALDAPEASFAKGGTPGPNTPSTVRIKFGSNNRGSPFPPPDHDASYHAKDKITPHVTHLAVGGTAIFDMDAFHGVAIYGPGTRPEDIVISPETLDDLVGPGFTIPDFLINDPTNRLARSDLALAPMEFTAEVFDQPGRYLVICYVLPHFAEVKMYAWIEVR